MTSAPAIGFEYRPSRLLARLVLVMSIIAAIAVLACAMAWWWKAILLTLVVLSVLRGTRQTNPPQSASWSAESGWRLRFGDGEELAVALRAWRVLGSCVLLQLERDRRHRYALWLLPDNSDTDIRRRLRMRLASAEQEGRVDAG